MCEQFVVLRAIETGEVSWSTTIVGKNPERMADGSIGYKVIAYADTAEEAQDIWSKSHFMGLL